MTKPGDLPTNNWEEEYKKEHKLRQEAEGELTIVKGISVHMSPEMRDANAKIKELRLGFSDIHDIGVFAKEDIPTGTNFGMTHVQISDTIVRTPLGGFLNHKDIPNCEKVKLRFTSEDKQPAYHFNKWNLIAIKDIKEGEELTLNYTFYDV